MFLLLALGVLVPGCADEFRDDVLGASDAQLRASEVVLVAFTPYQAGPRTVTLMVSDDREGPAAPLAAEATLEATVHWALLAGADGALVRAGEAALSRANPLQVHFVPTAGVEHELRATFVDVPEAMRGWRTAVALAGPPDGPRVRGWLVFLFVLLGVVGAWLVVHGLWRRHARRAPEA